MKNEDCRLRVKRRPSIHGTTVVAEEKKTQIHVNDHLLDICFHKSIPVFSGTSSKTGKYNRNLEPFSIRETSRLNFPRRDVFVTRDRELVQHCDVYA